MPLPNATDMPETLTVPLRQALTVGEGEAVRSITHLDLREPTVGEMKKAEVLIKPVAITMRVIALVAGVPESAVRSLAGRDLAKAGDFCSRFVVAPVAEVDLATLPDQKTFPLDKPLTGPLGPVDSILLKEPLAGQYEEYAGLSDWARTARAIATVAALPETVIDQLPVRQAARMEAYLDAFFAVAP